MTGCGAVAWCVATVEASQIDNGPRIVSAPLIGSDNPTGYPVNLSHENSPDSDAVGIDLDDKQNFQQGCFVGLSNPEPRFSARRSWERSGSRTGSVIRGNP